ncbi:hypothetical protein GQ607_016903, partial [Colletotrichum asianum]
RKLSKAKLNNLIYKTNIKDIKGSSYSLLTYINKITLLKFT